MDGINVASKTVENEPKLGTRVTSGSFIREKIKSELK